MPDTWANSSSVAAFEDGGIDLHIVVDRTGRRIAASLEGALREAVRDGRLRPGTTVPPTRTLAADLGIARNTVAAVYGRLVDEGWLVARQGSRTRVADGPHLRPEIERPANGSAEPRPLHDLRAGFPDPTSFPARWWAAVTREVLDGAAATAAVGYDHPGGSLHLRSALAGYLGRVRGVDTHADRIVVTAGFTSGLRALAEVLRRAGITAVGVEAYGHSTHRQALRDAGLDVVPLDVDEQGALPDSGARVGAVLLTSAHQFPLGMALSPTRRGSFVRWAQANDALIIEDDYDGEFRYDRRAIGAMQPHAPNHIVYAGTTSKTLAPGVGLGWFAAPTHLVGHIIEAQRGLGSRPAPLAQAVLAELIESGRFDRHVRRMRSHYRTRRLELTSVAQRNGWTVTGVDAGLHAIVELPPDVTEIDAVEACRRFQVTVQGLRSYAADDAVAVRSPALVVGYGTPPPATYSTALDRLRAALAGVPTRRSWVGDQPRR